MALTEKQKAFVREYLVDLNATAAAKRAGYSEKTAYSVGNENLTKPEIAKAIQKAMQDRQERTEITQDKVIQEIAGQAFKEASDAPESDFKHSSKVKYLDMLCRHLGAYEGSQDKQEEGVTVEIDV